MEVLYIPARNDLPNYKFKITLSGVKYEMHFRFNVRMNRWIIDVNDVTGEPILSGTPVLIARALFNQYTSLPLPEGTAFAVDYTQKDTQPEQFSFELTHKLVYVDPTQ